MKFMKTFKENTGILPVFFNFYLLGRKYVV